MKQQNDGKPVLQLVLAAPRGFCAGVDRAIQIVEQALELYDQPVYVRHEIVHNRHVVADLEARGAVFVQELDEVPDDALVIFSAHGVPKSVPEQAGKRGLNWLDATCPLVSKVHIEAERHYEQGRDILLIGHAGHPEVIGTMGQLPENAVTLIETTEDAQNYQSPTPENLAYVTQTTLSVDDTAEIIAILKRRFPAIHEPHKGDICYATTNRQAAVQEIAREVERLFVIGAPNSSNSMRLVEVAKQAAKIPAELIANADALDIAGLTGCRKIGLTAGASAPEILVRQVIDKLHKHFALTVREHINAREEVVFKLPHVLRQKQKAKQKQKQKTQPAQPANQAKQTKRVS